MAKGKEINGHYFTFAKPDYWAMNKHSENIAKGITDLHAIYNDASSAKWRAYNYCLDLCREMNGHSPSVINGNTFKFTFGFYFYETSEETGEILYEYFCKVTDCYHYIWEV